MKVEMDEWSMGQSQRNDGGRRESCRNKSWITRLNCVRESEVLCKGYNSTRKEAIDCIVFVTLWLSRVRRNESECAGTTGGRRMFILRE